MSAGLASIAAAQTTQAVDAAATQPSVDETTITGADRLYTPASPEAMRRVTQEVFPAVVRLDIAQETYRNGKRTLQRGIGSGVIVDDEGHVLTNYHVAGRAADIWVTLWNKERVRGKLIGDDHWTDIAIVQIDMPELKKRGFDVKHVEIGSSRELVPGQDVVAIGTPFGLSRTLTLGVVSNTERTFYPDNPTIDEFETGWFNNWIQMDTPIAPGNSGGPLVDMNGKLVGINTRGIQGQALNFAIPIDTAIRVANEIKATAEDEKKGRVTRADLGIEFTPLQDLESFYDLDINRGALISTVDRNSPAEKAGLKPQDILLSIAGDATNIRFPEEIAPVKARIAALPLGQAVELQVRRNGQEMTVSATPSKLESAVGDEKEFKTWGVSVREVTRRLASQMQLEDDLGVVVTTTNRGYPADKAELQAGDVIRKLNGKPVEDLEAFETLYGELEKESKVIIETIRGHGVRTTVLKN